MGYFGIGVGFWGLLKLTNDVCSLSIAQFGLYYVVLSSCSRGGMWFPAIT